jgi:Holliday junction resolvase RusA-like endonuclease
MSVHFSVDCVAESQGSMKAFIIEGRVDPRNPCTTEGKPIWVQKPRAILTSDNPDLKAYRRHIAAEAHNALVRAKLPKPMAAKHVPVALEIRFCFLKPASVTAKRKQMVVRPDADKCLRSTLDALTGILYLDDAQVVEITTRKQYGAQARVDITARILDPFAQPLTLPLVEDF